MYGQVYGVCAAPVKECQNEQLVTKDAFAKDMVKDTAKTFEVQSCFGHGRVIDNIAFGRICLLCLFLAYYAMKTPGHGKKQNTPVHFWTGKQTVEAILANFKNAVELRFGHEAYGLTKNTENHHGQNLFRHVPTPHLVQRMFGKDSSYAKTRHEVHN